MEQPVVTVDATAFYTAQNVADICCNEVIPDLNEEGQWLTFEEDPLSNISNDDIECIRSLLIQNNLNSFTILCYISSVILSVILQC